MLGDVAITVQFERIACSMFLCESVSRSAAERELLDNVSAAVIALLWFAL
jgi:hypothetical protein